MRTGGLLVGVVVMLGLLGCSRETGKPAAEALRLPDGYYGSWELIGTSGGMDGRGLEVGEGVRLVLTREQVAEYHEPGKPTRRERFAVRLDRSIFSAEPVWFLAGEGDTMGGRVIELSADGMQLTLSDNHPDGFNHHYRRLGGPQGTAESAGGTD